MKMPNVSRSLFHSNRGLSVGMFIMFALVAVSAALAVILPGSVRQGIYGFLEEMHRPDAWIVTDAMDAGPKEQLARIPGVRAVEAGLTAEVGVELEKGERCALRLTGVEEDGIAGFYVFEEAEVTGCGVWISDRFAEDRGIRCGDTLTMLAPREQTLTVEKIVTTPECVGCTRDDLSWFDPANFGYLYMPRAEAEALLDKQGEVNRWCLQMEDGAEPAAVRRAVAEAEKLLGDHVQSTVIFEDSQIKAWIDSELAALRRTVIDLQTVIFAIGLIFAALFLCQMVEKERKKIGLLRALGATRGQVFGLFLRYVGTISAVAILLGGTAGVLIARRGLEIYRSLYSLPAIPIVWKPVTALGMLLAFAGIDLGACLISADLILRVDPCEACSGRPLRETASPRWVTCLPIPAQIKIALAPLWRNRGRMVQATLSVAVCIVLTAMSLAALFSKNATFPATFGGRLRYEGMARLTGEEALDAVRDVAGVKTTEPMRLFRGEIRSDSTAENAQLNTLPETGDLIVLSDPEGNRVYPEPGGILLDEWFAGQLGVAPGDTVTVDGVTLKVTGLVREHIRSVQYVTADTAASLGHPQANACLFMVEDWADLRRIGEDISRTEGVQFVTLTEDQETSVHSSFRGLDLVLYAYIAIAMALGCIIVYNMMVISISERKKDHATLLALGASGKELTQIFLWENLLRYAAAAAVAVLPGLWAARRLMTDMSTLGHSYPPVALPWAVALACALSLVYVGLGMAVGILRVMRIDPAVTLNAEG